MLWFNHLSLLSSVMLAIEILFVFYLTLKFATYYSIICYLMYTNISNAFALYVSQHLFHKMIKSTQYKSNFKDDTKFWGLQEN